MHIPVVVPAIPEKKSFAQKAPPTCPVYRGSQNGRGPCPQIYDQVSGFSITKITKYFAYGHQNVKDSLPKSLDRSLRKLWWTKWTGKTELVFQDPVDPL